MTQCPRHFLLSHPDANTKHKASLMKIILALLLTALAFCGPANVRVRFDYAIAHVYASIW